MKRKLEKSECVVNANGKKKPVHKYNKPFGWESEKKMMPAREEHLILQIKKNIK